VISREQVFGLAASSQDWERRLLAPGRAAPRTIATPSTKIENFTKERFMFGSPLGNERLTGIVPGRWPGITLLPGGAMLHSIRFVVVYL